MVLQLGFNLSRESHIDTKSKGLKGRQDLLLGCRFLKQRSNCIRLWKGIGKLDIMVKGIQTKFDTKVGSSYHSFYGVR